jgi:hypothetical protein
MQNEPENLERYRTQQVFVGASRMPISFREAQMALGNRSQWVPSASVKVAVLFGTTSSNRVDQALFDRLKGTGTMRAGRKS